MKNSLLIVVVLFLSVFANCKKADNTDVNLAADFAIKNLNGEVNEGVAVVVANNSSFCKTASYAWDFGNGKTSTEKEPSFAYGMHGDYNIKLTITDERGRTSTFTKAITVLCVFTTVQHAPLF